MKTLICTIFCLAGVAFDALADSTINEVNRFAYGANIGWLDCRADGANGAVIGEYVCSGYIYAANVGWIHLGDGTPVNGIRYQNNSAADYGVNHDGLGHLRGYAYGANIGWVSLEDQGAPTVDLQTGVLSGYIYAANAGWISLSNTLTSGTRVFVQTGPPACPDSDGDGIADGYEIRWAGNLLVMDGTTDRDGDGVSDRNEFLADTNPTDAADFLRITAISTADGGLHCDITWTSRPTRQYRIQKRDSFSPDTAWVDSGLGLQLAAPGLTTTRTVPDAAADERYFRVQAVKPLSP
jgi:hypothetical protein